MGSCVSQTSTGCAAVPGQVSEPREVGPRVCSVAVAPVRLDRKPHGATRSLGRYLPVSNLDVQQLHGLLREPPLLCTRKPT